MKKKIFTILFALVAGFGFSWAATENSITINGTPQVGGNSISLTYYFDPDNVPGLDQGFAPTLKVKCVTDNKWDEIWLSTFEISSGTTTITLDNLGSFQEGKSYDVCFAYNNGNWVDDVFQSFTPATPVPATVAVTGVTLSQSEAAMTVGGETLTLTATVVPDDATDKTVVWTSSDPTVATVANGVVTAVAAGTAIITATATNGTPDDKTDDKTATCTITVTDPDQEAADAVLALFDALPAVENITLDDKAAIEAARAAYNALTDDQKALVTPEDLAKLTAAEAALAALVTTGVENVQGDVKNVKTMVNGQIFILRGDKTFTLQGQDVK